MMGFGWRLLGAVVFAAAIIGFSDNPANARAYSSIVIDAANGDVLSSHRPDAPRYPASLAKVMTLYLVFEALDTGRLSLEDKLPVSRRAAGQPASRIGLTAGTRVRVVDLVLALVTKSANDAATVLAEGMAASEVAFAKRMTAKARELGMRRTTFTNASGLPNRHQRTTARDMATLARRLLIKYPDYYAYFATREFTYGKRTYRNHNRLLKRYAGADGIKTGYIDASGFNLMASARRGGRRVIAVVFGGRTSSSRDRHTMALLDRGFDALATRVAAVSAPPPLPAKKPGTKGAEPTEELALGPDPVSQSVLEKPRQVGSAELNWGIQVGAYSNLGIAQHRADLAARLVPDLLDESTTQIEAVKNGPRTLYRAQLSGLNEDQARLSCRYLAHQQLGCIVVPPGD